MRALGAARIAIGVLFIVRTTPLLAALRLKELRGSWPLLGWPDDRWHGSPTIPLPAAAVAGLCIARTTAAVAFMLGVETRVVGLVAGLAGYLVLLQHPFALEATLHLLFLATLLLAFTDAGSAFALRPAAPRAPASGITMMRLFAASIYAWAGIGKLRADWVDGRTLDTLFHQRWLSGSLAAFLLATAERRAMVAWTVMLGELALAPLLLWRRTRPFGLAAAVAFHVVAQIMGRPGLLGFEMAALLLCFLPGLTDARKSEPRPATR